MINQTLQCEYFTVEEFPNILNKIAKNGGIKFCGNGRKYRYLDISSSFDIEVTNFKKIIKNTKFSREMKRKIKKEIKKTHKISLMYIWQFAITDDTTGEIYTIIGRTWDEFQQLIDIINQTMSYITVTDYKFYWPIYIHNLSFEYFFIKHYLDIEDVFVTKANTPLYVRTENIEFRCSYFLSGCGLKSLPKFIDNLDPSIYKLVGDMDYDKIRTPLTPLTDLEMAYCINDVRLLNAYISQKRKDDGNVSKISLTKTGYARKFIEKMTMGDKVAKKQHIRTISELKFHSTAEFTAVTEAYMGGHTAANPWNNGIILEDVTCYDFTSSYPAVMCYSDDFPIAYIGDRENMTEQELRVELGMDNAVIGLYKFTNLRPYELDDGSKCSFDSFIPSSKCKDLWSYQRNKKGEIVKDKITGEPIKGKEYVKYNNGKVAEADYVEIYLTEMDFYTYELFYKWDKLELYNVHIYKKGYLPRNTIAAVLQLYTDKTTLKGNEERALEYCLKKEILNSLYGMAVTSPLKDILAYDGKKWRPRNNKGWIDEVYSNHDAYLIEKVEQYNKNLSRGKISIPYIQGIYVSGIARYNLSLGICSAGVKGLFCYSDTDSIYVQHASEIDDFIKDYNDYVKLKMEKMCLYYSFPIDIWRPKNDKGEEKPLGYWDFDGHSKYYKTLGAKRYIKLDDNDHFKITIAGLGKKQGAEYIAKTFDKDCEITDKGDIILKNYKKVFDAFKIGLKIPSEKTGKLTHAIYDGDYEGTLTDYNGVDYQYHIYGGVYLEPASFEMSMDERYSNFIAGLLGGQEITYYD